MKTKLFSEQELIEGLDAESAHADELAVPLQHELSPLQRLKRSVERYVRPTEPVWDEYFDADEGVSDDFMESRDQPFSEE
jgi:antitoxin VapB